MPADSPARVGTVTAMTRDEARAFVALHAAPEAAPALTPDEVEACLTGARVVDAAGLAVGDAGYTETIWAARAVANVWDVKCTRAVGRVDVTADGATVAASQLLRQARGERARWLARCANGAS